MAEEYVEQIEELLCKLEKLSKSGAKTDKRIEIIDRALEVAGKIRFDLSQDCVLRDIAEKLVDIGYKNIAIVIAFGIKDYVLQIKTLLSILEKLSEQGEKNNKVIDNLIYRTLEVADMIENYDKKIMALLYISEKLWKMRQKTDIVDELINIALKVADDIGAKRYFSEYEWDQSSALSFIIMKLLDMEKIDKALEIAEKIEDYFTKSRDFADIAKKLQEIGGSKKRVQGIIDKSIDYAFKNEYAFTKIENLKYLEECLIELGETDRALEVADMIRNNNEQDEISIKLKELEESFKKWKETGREIE